MNREQFEADKKEFESQRRADHVGLKTFQPRKPVKGSDDLEEEEEEPEDEKTKRKKKGRKKGTAARTDP